jgi:hypothetical protein
MDRFVARYPVDEHFWSSQIEEIRQGAVSAESKAERRRWLGLVFALCSGMGGLTDLVLQRNGKVLPSQATMASLRQQLYSSAVDLLEA